MAAVEALIAAVVAAAPAAIAVSVVVAPVAIVAVMAAVEAACWPMPRALFSPSGSSDVKISPSLFKSVSLSLLIAAARTALPTF
jgi:hypothetical protein